MTTYSIHSYISNHKYITQKSAAAKGFSEVTWKRSEECSRVNHMLGHNNMLHLIRSLQQRFQVLYNIDISFFLLECLFTRDVLRKILIQNKNGLAKTLWLKNRLPGM